MDLPRRSACLRSFNRFRLPALSLALALARVETAPPARGLLVVEGPTEGPGGFRLYGSRPIDFGEPMSDMPRGGPVCEWHGAFYLLEN